MLRTGRSVGSYLRRVALLGLMLAGVILAAGGWWAAAGAEIPVREAMTNLAAVQAAELAPAGAPARTSAQAPTLTPAQGDHAMVVTAHPQATEVGVAVLRSGGNAADAAIAVALALAVVEPYSSGIGGGGFALVYEAATGEVRALDFRETAPAAAGRDMFLVDGQADTGLSQTGPLAVAVPGQVRGLAELHRVYGTLAWQRLLEPACVLAREGFPISPQFRERIERHAGRFNAPARQIFLPGGELPAVGDSLCQSDLAATLFTLATAGAEALYNGALAESLVAGVQREGGLLTIADLDAYRPVWRETVNGHYRGLTIHSMPPPSSGGVHLLQMLNILAGYDLKDLFLHQRSGNREYFKYASAPGCHYLIEAMKLAFADRSRWLGDPDFVQVPVARLLSSAYADSQRAKILSQRALSWRSVPGVRVLPPDGEHTSHVSVVDSVGNAIALTLTINLNFGSGLVAGRTGVLLNDEMDDFVAAPGVPNAFNLIGGEPNAVAPGKRPLSSMTPTIALDGRRVIIVVGGPGGSRIITSVLQVILNLVDGGMDVARAVRAPRLHQQWYPPEVWYESDGMTSGCQYALKERGHELVLHEPMGNVQALWIDPVTGRRYGASDPRGIGTASGY